MNIVKIIKQVPEMEAQFAERHVNKARCVRIGHSPDHQVADKRHEDHCGDEMPQDKIPSTSRSDASSNPEAGQNPSESTKGKVPELRGAEDLTMGLTKETVSGP